ncbi:MAG: cobalamin-dependent protein [Sedimenticolaceae bacterium]
MKAQTQSARSIGTLLQRQCDEIATTLINMESSRHINVPERPNESERSESLKDANYQLSCLAGAISADNRELFVDYVAWAKVLHTQRGMSPEEQLLDLNCMCEALRFELPAESAEVAVGFVRHAIERFPSLPDEVPSFLNAEHPQALLANRYLQALMQGDRQTASRLILDAVESGVAVHDIYLHVFQTALYEIGRLWQTKQISVAREHYCTTATQMIMSQLFPYVSLSARKNGGIVVTTCVAGDLHEIGGRMVADFMEMAGWESYHLGANTPTTSVVAELIERRADVLGISASIPSDVSAVADLIAAVRTTPQCADIKILVGGYLFNQDRVLWLKLGADGYALDALAAVAKAGAWLDQRQGNRAQIPRWS